MTTTPTPPLTPTLSPEQLGAIDALLAEWRADITDFQTCTDPMTPTRERKYRERCMLLGAFLDQVLDVLAQEHPQAIAVDLKQLVLSERTKLVESRTEAERPDVRAGQQKRLREYITVVGTCIDRLREVAGPEICGQRASIIFRTVRHG